MSGPRCAWLRVVTAPSVEPGELVVDTLRDKVGEVQAYQGGRYYLRPVGGGIEWEVDPQHLRLADKKDELRARVTADNTRRRWLQ